MFSYDIIISQYNFLCKAHPFRTITCRVKVNCHNTLQGNFISPEKCAVNPFIFGIFHFARLARNESIPYIHPVPGYPALNIRKAGYFDLQSKDTRHNKGQKLTRPDIRPISAYFYALLFQAEGGEGIYTLVSSYLLFPPGLHNKFSMAPGSQLARVYRTLKAGTAQGGGLGETQLNFFS